MRSVVDITGAPVDLATALEAFTRPEYMDAVADIYKAGVLQQIAVKLGSMRINFDRAAASRSWGSFEVYDPVVPIRPDGTEIRLWLQTVIPGQRAFKAMAGNEIVFGTEELEYFGESVVFGEPSDTAMSGQHTADRVIRVSMGLFTIRSSQYRVRDKGWGIESQDRFSLVADALTEDAINLSNAFYLENYVHDILRDALPSIPFPYVILGPIHAAPNRVVERSADPRALVLELAQSVGSEAYFDSDGQFIIRPEPNLLYADAVYTFRDGYGGNVEAGTIVQGWSREDVHNGFPVSGDNPMTDATFNAEYRDDDGASETYYYGPFGKKPTPVHRDENVDSQAKADASSLALRQAGKGREEVYGFRAAINPMIEGGDVVQLNLACVGVLKNGVVEKQSFDGPIGSMDITVKTNR